MSELTILLPTYNEEQNIQSVIDDIKQNFINVSYEIVVVDSASSDATQAIARNNGARVINFPERGKAKAFARALKEIDSQFLIMFDADQTYLAKDAINVYLKLKAGNDVVIGSRIRGHFERGSMNLINLIGNHFLRYSAFLLYGKKISDLCSGMWGFSRKVYKMLSVDSNHFELEANLYVECAKHNIDIFEVPITYRKRRGASKLRLWDGVLIFKYLLNHKKW